MVYFKILILISCFILISLVVATKNFQDLPSIRPVSCSNHMTGEIGVCTYNWFCNNVAHGVHIGSCVDRYFVGSCCRIPKRNDPTGARKADATSEGGAEAQYTQLDAIASLYDRLLAGKTEKKLTDSGSTNVVHRQDNVLSSDGTLETEYGTSPASETRDESAQNLHYSSHNVVNSHQISPSFNQQLFPEHQLTSIFNASHLPPNNSFLNPTDSQQYRRLGVIENQKLSDIKKKNFINQDLIKPDREHLNAKLPLFFTNPHDQWKPIVHDQRNPVSTETSHNMRRPVSPNESHNLRKPVSTDESHDLSRPVSTDESHDLSRPVSTDESHDLRRPVNVVQSHDQRRPVSVEESHDQRWPVLEELSHDERLPEENFFPWPQNQPSIIENKINTAINTFDENSGDLTDSSNLIISGNNTTTDLNTLIAIFKPNTNVTGLTTSTAYPWPSPKPAKEGNASMPLNSQSILRDVSRVCGRSRSYTVARIVGGRKSSYHQWPWMISLRRHEGRSLKHKCGAALLNQQWAITAAHCVHGKIPTDLMLRLGEYNFHKTDDSHPHLDKRVYRIVIHPKFDSITYENDVALLRFFDPVYFQANIIPVCLPKFKEDISGKIGIVTGWGRLSEEGELPSSLHEVSIPILTNKECEDMYAEAGYSETIRDVFLCAGLMRGGLDACEGDSGGPMVTKGDKGQWVLVGLISWGLGCGAPKQPGVYTRITKFVDWIDEVTSF